MKQQLPSQPDTGDFMPLPTETWRGQFKVRIQSKKKILSALSVENPKPRSLSSFKDKVKKMKITFKLYLLI